MHYPDERFGKRIEKQLKKDGIESVIKSYNSLKRCLEEHRAKLSNAIFKSSVEREIQTFERQIRTIEEEFLSKKRLDDLLK